MRGVLDACADCDTCRIFMDESCLFFPELYRLFDKQTEEGKPVDVAELQKLSELCTLCGLCPCPNIPADVIRGKTEYARMRGIPLGARLLADVQLLGRWCGMIPGVANTVIAFAPFDRTVKKIAGIHPKRRLPEIARESFFAWAQKKGLDRHPPEQAHRTAYFAGCTAGYFFPQVAIAAVKVMEKNGISVFVPRQQCCGMPTLLEGDKETTLQRISYNLEMLLETTHSGYDLVCSCPTCGFLIKVLLKERACYSDDYQRSVNAGADEIKNPDNKGGTEGFVSLNKSMYHKILKDDGYFNALGPLKRIALSGSMLDMGEYLNRLYLENRFNTRFGRLVSRMVYFAPCHQREQGIGSPYEKLLALIPGLEILRVGGALDCCGMGGSLGFKESFYEKSVELGRFLFRKIEAAVPDAIITDCMSCRLQFEHMLPYKVFHPLEVLSRAYESADLAQI